MRVYGKRNMFGHGCDITGKTFADRAKNTERYIAIPPFNLSQIAPVQSALGRKNVLTIPQENPFATNTKSKP
jgi:hypothetical protein